MKLRTHINLIVGCFSAALIALAVYVELDGTRRAIREEISATHVVASLVLGHVADRYGTDAGLPLRAFLESLGRVRANEITLFAGDGSVLYESPRATYKAGREAPQWFTRLLLPTTPVRDFTLQDGSRLVVKADASRSILDGWDDLTALLVVGVITLGLLNALVFWRVGRALAPLPVIATGLNRIQQGELTYRLPSLRGFEAGIIGNAFNAMAQAMQEKVQAERQARDAEARLDERRELDQLIEQRVDEERRMIARELHDEFAQSVTAIRSLAVVISTHAGDAESPTGRAAEVISSEAMRLYDAMHGLIPRLAPLTLDTLGLAETLQGFVDEWQRRHPSIRLSLRQNLPMTLGSSVTLAIYRVVQEAVINALRHGQPTSVQVSIDCTVERVIVSVVDDGLGLPAEWARPGSFGLRGLRERLEKLAGSLRVSNRDGVRGVEVAAEIPLGAVA